MLVAAGVIVVEVAEEARVSAKTMKALGNVFLDRKVFEVDDRKDDNAAAAAAGAAALDDDGNNVDAISGDKGVDAIDNGH